MRIGVRCIVRVLGPGLALLAAVSPAAGGDGLPSAAGWAWRFLGRLHPMAVHFPIALLLTAALLEIFRALRRRPAPGSVALPLLVLGALAAAAAAALGWANADFRDDHDRAAELLLQHRLLGVTAAGLALAAAALGILQRRRPAPARGRLYLLALLACAGVLSAAGHRGGQLSLGEDYVTSAIPDSIRAKIPGLAPAPAGDSAATAAFAGKTDFRRDVLPIFRAQCFTCHGPEKQKGDLRLDAKDLAIRGGKSNRAIVPADGEKSTLWRRLQGLDHEKRMPQNAAPLPEAQIALIRKWIDDGAEWPDAASVKGATIRKHWSYVMPVRPEVPRPRSNVQGPTAATDPGPRTSDPATGGSGWIRNPIDAFVLARLEKERLVPSPGAPRETLIRRVSLDLTGLPPTPEEADAFAADASPDAYEKLVDRLLASPHFGERWARPWLDLARYADTNGFQGDRTRRMWKYRDWVIGAFNRDLPFDRFTIEQIAGDMLPDATDETRIASGFHRNTMINQEGGVDKNEARWETIVDRVGTTGTVWLGSTVMCSQCHDHKFDPFTQKDFYGFFAFFENADEPVLKLPTPEQSRAAASIEAKIARVEAEMKARAAEVDAGQPAWEQDMRAALDAWTPLDADRIASAGGATLTKLEDRSVLASGPNPDQDVCTFVAATTLERITGVRLEVLTHASLPHEGPGRYNSGQFVLTGFEVEAAPQVPAPGSSASAPRPLRFRKAVADYAQAHYPVTDLIGDEPGRLGWAVDAWRKGFHIDRQAIFLVDGDAGFPGGTRLTFRLRQESKYAQNTLGRFRLSVTGSATPERSLDLPIPLAAVLAAPPERRSPEPAAALAGRYRAIAPLLRPERERLAALRRELEDLDIVTTFSMQERPSYERPFTYLRKRGNYVNRADPVYAATPAFLHPFPGDRLPDRLGLAYWLVSPENPLVGRVTVNRFWEQIFGRGIVETSEDFGAQGQPPLHPELLDWLATEFTGDLRWSMKGLIRLIVTSSAYRQSSAVTPERLEKDPFNTLISRGPRFRVEAEMVRDAALSVSGLLSPTIGGPGVFPPQPEGTLPYIPFNTEVWKESEGADRYRRGIYTFWRRTSPYPTFMTFDAPSREVCTVRRTRTNTPLQALAVLNDPVFVECAQALGRRLAVMPGDVRARAAYGLRLCIARKPSPEETEPLAALYEKQRDRYRQDPEAARKLVAGPAPVAAAVDAAELAAWTVVANAILNLDETVTKE